MDKPMKPKIEKAIYDFGYWWYICPACSMQINYAQSECKRCHQKIEWTNMEEGDEE